jgi:hypothetical protein
MLLLARPAAETPQALFREARRRRRRRWIAEIASFAAVAAVTVGAVTLSHPAARRPTATSGLWSGVPGARSAVAGVVWYDGVRLDIGYVRLNGQVTYRSGPEVNAGYLPLLRAGDRVYWVDSAGTFVPALGHWSQIVQYLDLSTGVVGTAGPGQTVFAAPGRRTLFMSQPLGGMTQTPAAGGAARQFALPRGWYLPGGDGLPDLVPGEGIATANGVIVQSTEQSRWRPHLIGVWSPGTRAVRVLGRALTVIGAYTGRAAGYSLVAWLPAGCEAPGSCPLKITNTATGSTLTVRGPPRRGFAAGGAFSPDGGQLAVFVRSGQTARLALVDPVTGALRLARGIELRLGVDYCGAYWLPHGRLVVAAGNGFLVNTATLAAKPLVLARGHGRTTGNIGNIGFNGTVVPLPR